MLYITVYGTNTDVWVGNFDEWETFKEAARQATVGRPWAAECLDPLELLLEPDEWIGIEDALRIAWRLRQVAVAMPEALRDSARAASRACHIAARQARPLRVYA